MKKIKLKKEKNIHLLINNMYMFLILKKIHMIQYSFSI